MKRAISILSIYLLVLATMPSFATSGAHFFHDTSATVDLSTGGLVINIDEAGVGQAEVDYSFSIAASATYQCFNGGGNHPKAANKATFSSTVTGTAQFSPLNGRVQQTLTVSGTPLSTNGFGCPGGQTLYLVGVSYSVVLTDTTNAVTAPTLTAGANNLFIPV
jgi:hypothetical protein